MSDESPRFDPAGFAELPDKLALGQLPPGRHGLPRAFVVRNQRLRMVAALLRMLPLHGYAETTIGHITREARVSRAAFYGQFAGKEECFLEAYDLASTWLCDGVEDAVADEAWPSRVRVGVGEVLRLLAANPPLAHLIAIEALQAGPAARKRQQASLARLAEILRHGRPDRPELPGDLEQLLLGGALSVVARHVENEKIEQLPEIETALVECLLIPYLGPAKSKRIAA
ncbi:MAG TPA: helix-turn-helix domain-containing protein [Solirubrobacterales bacterium]|nr:helix-turn-helix domain-containing protein [Solirubrobacterales bacterium]